MARVVTQVETVQCQNLQGFFCQHVGDKLCSWLHQVNQTAVFVVRGKQERNQYTHWHYIENVVFTSSNVSLLLPFSSSLDMDMYNLFVFQKMKFKLISHHFDPWLQKIHWHLQMMGTGHTLGARFARNIPSVTEGLEVTYCCTRWLFQRVASKIWIRYSVWSFTDVVS